jgi:hypothetical protein
MKATKFGINRILLVIIKIPPLLPPAFAANVSLDRVIMKRRIT